jgi:hypothetical protein
MTRIPVNPELLTWARERAGLEGEAHKSGVARHAR